MSQTQFEGSPVGGMAGTDWMSVLKGLGIACLAGVIPVAIDYLAGLNIVDPKSAAIVAIIGIGLNILRKWLTNTQQQVVRVLVLAFGLLCLGAAAEAAQAVKIQGRTMAIEAVYSSGDDALLVQPVALRERSVRIERSRTGRRHPLATATGVGLRGVARGALLAPRVASRVVRIRR